MSKPVPGCNRAVKQGDLKKQRTGKIRKGHFRRAPAPPRVAPAPWTAGFETENQGNCAGGRKSVWARHKQHDPVGGYPRGLALTKHRRNQRIEFWLRGQDSNL
jgi:hypothetical protein